MQDRSDNSQAMIARAMQAEMLDADTELRLARAWHNDGDEAALHRLVAAYMRLAISMATKYRRYGASIEDLIGEAEIGLMKAAAKFDPERGVRFSTYAMWWIKAAIQEYVMRDWSMVRIGSTATQKSLFFNLRRVQAKVEREHAGETVDRPALTAMIAGELGLPLREVEMMQVRLAGADFSLNRPQAEGGRDWIEALPDEGPRSDRQVETRADTARVRVWLAEAIAKLNARERKIIIDRKLKEEPRTLASLADEFGLSKERIRQLEVQALRKLREALEEAADGAARDLVPR